MESDIRVIIEITNCTREQAVEALSKYKCVVDAVDSLTQPSKTVAGELRERRRTDEQKHFDYLRKITTELNESIERGLLKPQDTVTSVDQPESLVSCDLPVHREETVPQNNCSQGCRQHAPE